MAVLLYIPAFNSGFCCIPGKNIISILPPIPTVGLKKEDLNTLMEKSYNTMNQKYIELSKEVIAKHGDN